MIYREASPVEHTEPDRELAMLAHGVVKIIAPHRAGRWSCPACGAWRMPAWLTRNAAHAVGVVTTLTASEEKAAKSKHSALPPGAEWAPVGYQVLQRECPRCSYCWWVETKKPLAP
jgi:hypothetical protein